MKRILFVFIMLFMMFVFIDSVYAISGNNGSGSAANKSYQSGSWQIDGSHGYGLRVTVIDNTGKRIKYANFVKNTQWNSKNIYTSKESDCKIRYVLGLQPELNLGNYSKNIVQYDSVKKFTEGGLNEWLSKNDYSNLRKLLKHKKLKYYCWEKSHSSDSECANSGNHLVIVEPITVQGTYNTRYDWLTAYEFAVKLAGNGNLVNVFSALNDGLYGLSNYKIGGKEFPPGKKSTSSDGCGSNCDSYLVNRNLGGAGVFINPNPPTVVNDKITVTKTWTAAECSSNLSKARTTFTIKYKNAKKKWVKFKTLTISGSSGSQTVTFPHVKGREYKVYETKAVVGGCSKPKIKNPVSESKAFSIKQGGTHQVNFKNTLEKCNCGTSTAYLLVTVDEFNSQFHTITSSKPADLTNGVDGYYWKRIYGGKKLACQSQNCANGFQCLPKDCRAFEETDLHNRQIFLGTELTENGAYDDIGKYSIITNTNTAQDTIAYDWIYKNTYDKLTKCRAANNYVVDSDSVYCFQLCYKGNNSKGEHIHTCYASPYYASTETNPAVVGLLNVIDANSSQYKEFGVHGQPNVTVTVQSQDGKFVKTELTDGYSSMNGTFRAGDKLFTVPADTPIRVSIQCENCGHYQTYSKLNADAGISSGIAFQTGTTTKHFKVSKSYDSMYNPYHVRFFNNNHNVCGAKLEKIKASSSGLKDQLFDLYHEEKEEGNDYLKLLNYKPNDDDNTIKNKIGAGTISCASYNSSVTPSLSGNCNDRVLKMTYANPDQMTVADFVGKGNAASNIAYSLFDLESDENEYCIVNYELDFASQNIIKNGVDLKSTAWLWPAIYKNKVGVLKPKIYCVGDISNINDRIQYSGIANLFDDIKLTIDNDPSVVQRLKIYDSKITQNSDNVDYYTRNMSLDDNLGDIDAGILQELEGIDETVVEENISDDVSSVNFLTDSNKCPGDTTFKNNACHEKKSFCPANYSFSPDLTSCISSVDGSFLTKEKELKDILCGDRALFKANDNNSGICEIENPTVSCPAGYTLNIDSQCYKTDDSVDDESVSSGFSFQSITDSEFAIGYDISYYGDLLTGTASYKRSGKSYLGWGVPIPLEKQSGSVNIKVSFNSDSDVYKLYNNAKALSSENAFGMTCNFRRNQTINIGKNRIIDSEVPFPGKDGKTRNKGLNWDSCYVSFVQKLGKISNFSCYDLYGSQNNIDIDGAGCNNGDTYCMYGDTNCDGKFDDTDKNNYINNQYVTNTAQKKVMDIDQNGVVDNIDYNLYLTWYSAVFGNGKSKNANKEEKTINFKDRTTYEGYSENNMDYSSCDSYVDRIIKNKYKSSSSTRTPLYSFRLTSEDMLNIRNSQKESYIDTSKLVCNSYGYCISDYITNLITDKGLSMTGVCSNRKNKKKIDEFDSENNNKTYEELFCQ